MISALTPRTYEAYDAGRPDPTSRRAATWRNNVAPKVKTRYRIAVNHNFCTGCGNCIAYCPMHVLAKDTRLNRRGIYAPVVEQIDRCTGCDLCEMYCGNFAIAVGERPEAEREGGA